MGLPKWTEERTKALVDFVGDESPVSHETVLEAADELETTPKSVAAKLRKMEYEVESSAAVVSKKFSDEQEETLRAFVEDNSGVYTYAEIADAFEDGAFTSKQIQGKLLSMQLTQHVKPTPKVENQRTFTAKEEAAFVAMAAKGAFLEEIADKLGRTINQVRGKALSLLRSKEIEAIPKQRDSKGATRVDPLEGIDVSSMTVDEIAEKIGKTARGVKTMLTRRGLSATDYDGAAKAEKAKASA